MESSTPVLVVRKPREAVDGSLKDSTVVKPKKFMQTIDDEIFGFLRSSAEARGVKVQVLIRAVIIPEWVNLHWQKSGILPQDLGAVNGGNRNVGRVMTITRFEVPRVTKTRR